MSSIFLGLLFLISTGFRTLSSIGLTPRVLGNALFSKEPLAKNYQNRTTIALLGMSGGTHEGADLSDTIILATFDWEKKKTFLISLPRDIWSPLLQDKINTSYHYGVEKQGSEEGGMILTKAVLEEIVGIPVHYSVKIEFDGFTKIVDVLGGVAIDVQPGFTDTKYPIEGKEEDMCDGDKTFQCRYRTVTFNQGVEQMNGERALIYVRSRNAENEQGTDIARGIRQQQVLFAVREKLFSPSTLFAFARNKQLFEIVTNATQTDMDMGNLLGAGKFVMGLSRASFITVPLPLEDSEKKTEGILIHPEPFLYGGRWVLTAKNEDVSLLHEYIVCKLDEKPTCDELYR